jgi:hypothetical protein
MWLALVRPSETRGVVERGVGVESEYVPGQAIPRLSIQRERNLSPLH